jgi:hypothetical protein
VLGTAATSQNRDVLGMLGGEGGKALHGKILELTDPEVIDSDKRWLADVEAVVFQTLPPELVASTLNRPKRRRSVW